MAQSLGDAPATWKQTTPRKKGKGKERLPTRRSPATGLPGACCIPAHLVAWLPWEKTQGPSSGLSFLS